MSLSLIFFIAILLIALGYFSYGSFICRIFGIDDKIKTPAHIFLDEKDFIPTNTFFLFCQHVSAIAASGPIVGPILACQMWGWFFPLAWIVIGVVLIGSVHDFGILCASVRNKGSSIVEIAKIHLGKYQSLILLWFIFIALIYVIIAFVQVTAATFVSSSEELLDIKTISFNKGGAVLSSALLYLFLCLILGLINKWLKPKIWLLSLIFVPATFFLIFIGMHISTFFIFNEKAIQIGIVLYCGIASLLPVWLLLQPRGFLGGFILLLVLIPGLFGALFGGFSIKQPAFIENDMLSNIFPFLFVTVACGACSGFHGLVCGGTTAKQIAKESDIKPVAYGAMLCEGIVALVALSTIMIFDSNDILNLKPGSIYSKGIGEYLTLIFGEKYRTFLTTFAAMAFSTFVFDTLDVATRIGRYLIEELFSLKGLSGKIYSVLFTIFLPFLIVVFLKSDAFISFWTLFGSANQLLAGLGLFTLTIWLRNHAKKYFITLMPMLFILCTTFVSLIKIFNENIEKNDGFVAIANGIIAILLLLMAISMIFSFFFKKLKLKIFS